LEDVLGADGGTAVDLIAGGAGDGRKGNRRVVEVGAGGVGTRQRGTKRTIDGAIGVGAW